MFTGGRTLNGLSISQPHVVAKRQKTSIVNQAQTEVTIVYLHVIINIHPRFVVNDFRFCQRIIRDLKNSVTAVAMLQI